MEGLKFWGHVRAAISSTERKEKGVHNLSVFPLQITVLVADNSMLEQLIGVSALHAVTGGLSADMHD